VSTLDSKRNGFVHFQADSADGAGFFAVVRFYRVFGLALLGGAVDFAEAAAHTVFLFGNYSFHSNFLLFVD
jgi:hypothetical protein